MSRRPHIAYVCSDRGVPVGGHKGASLHVAELVRALGQRGADVHILAARVASPECTTLGEAEVTDVGGSRGARRARETLLRSSDGLEPGGGTAEAAGILYNQELARALEKLHRARPVDAVYERYSLWSHAAAGFARAHGIPYLLEVNAPLAEEQKRYRELRNDAMAASLERYLFASADRVLVPSAALVAHAAAHGAHARNVVVVPNAADPARFRPARRRAAARDGFVIGFVGSLKPWHGLSDLALAFRRLARRDKGYRLLIVGDGPMRAEVEKQLDDWGLSSRATFTGAADHEAVPALVAAMDAALAPYPVDAPTYFSPIKIFEYMAAGVPIVASRVGQIAELLEHRRTALLYEPGSIAGLVACIEELRRRPALAQKVAAEGRRTLVRRYTWKRNAGQVLGLIDRIRKEQAAAARKDALAATGVNDGGRTSRPAPSGAGSRTAAKKAANAKAGTSRKASGGRRAR